MNKNLFFHVIILLIKIPEAIREFIFTNTFTNTPALILISHQELS